MFTAAEFMWTSAAFFKRDLILSHEGVRSTDLCRGWLNIKGLENANEKEKPTVGLK